MSFTDDEIAYLRSQPLTRFATVGSNGQPDVVPLAFEFDGRGFWVGGVGDAETETRKFRNVAAGNDRVALVFDDLISIDSPLPAGVRARRRARRARVGVGRPRRLHAHHTNDLVELEPRRQGHRRRVVRGTANQPRTDVERRLRCRGWRSSICQ